MSMRAMFLATVSGLLLCACGGGSSGGGGVTATEGLTTPDELAVVTPKEEGGGEGSVTPGTGVGDFPGDCDYFDDEADVWVYDSALEPLNLINMILCYMGQTAASELINEGYYNALIDTSLADEGGNQSAEASEEGQSSGSNEPDYELWVVGSTRVTDSSPQYVKVWVPDDDPEDDWDQVIRVHTVVTQGVSATNPFGQFTLNFAGIDPETGTVLDPMMFGTLETNDPVGGSIGFSFYQGEGDIDAVPQPGDQARHLQVNVQMDAEQTEGEAKILHQERYNWGEGDSGIITQEYLIAFNEEYLPRPRRPSGATSSITRTAPTSGTAWTWIPDSASARWRASTATSDTTGCGCPREPTSTTARR